MLSRIDLAAVASDGNSVGLPSPGTDNNDKYYYPDTVDLCGKVASILVK
jgi:hypothetical protein